MKWIDGLTVLFSLVIWGDVTGQLRSPYQASISLYQMGNSGSSKNIHVCNGAVIHERFILTTADCLHVRKDNVSRPHLPQSPSMFQVTAGSFETDQSNTRHAEAIYIHEKYNSHTLDNDIALVQLNEPFQLKNNPSIQWIEVDTRKAKYENCYISTENQTSKGYPFTVPQSTYVIENWFCNKNVNPPNSSERSSDICSYYILNSSSMCKLRPEEYQESVDRGTPLVCDYHLSGLLSQIIPPQTASNPNTLCESTLKIWAFYTNVTNYVDWIHEIIAKQQPTPSHTQTQLSVSKPFSSTSSIDLIQPPSSTPKQEHKTNGVECIAKSLLTIVLMYCINSILTYIQLKM